MKFYSKIFKAKVIASIFIIVWIIILILITINHSLSYVNPDGCLKETFKKVQREIKKTNLHLIKIDLNKYENKLRFYADPASVNYDAFVTREYIPKYCCEEIHLK